MKEDTENQRNSSNEVGNEDRSFESQQEDLVHSDNALKGFIPQGGDHFKPINENDQDDEEMNDDVDDEVNDVNEMDENADQDTNGENSENDPGTGNNENQSNVPLEFPDRNVDRNYTDPQAR